MLFGRDDLLIRREIVGADELDVEVLDLVVKCPASAFIAFSDVERECFACFAVKSMPTPTFLRFAPAHEGPKLVNLDLLVRTLKEGFRCSEHLAAQLVDNAARIEVQHRSDVADAAAVHGHFKCLFLQARVGSTVRIGVLELFLAVFAPIILFSVRLLAVFLDVCSLAVGAFDLDEYFEHTSNVA